MLIRLIRALGAALNRRHELAVRTQSSANPTFEDEEIDFRPLDPVLGSALAATFAVISRRQLRRRYDPVDIKTAQEHVDAGRVTITHYTDTQIHARVADEETALAHVRLDAGHIVSHCSCRTARRREEAGCPEALCPHALAAILTAIRNGEDGGPELSTALCPITRLELRPGARIYQCRVCLTAYSPEGRAFLKSANHGRCCQCGASRSIEIKHP